MKVGFTGHRPNKLWGYDYQHTSYIALKEKVKKFLIEEKVRIVYCGMALGFDTIVALAVLELKDEGFDIKLVACIPCANQECRWNIADRNLYKSILKRTDKIYGLNEHGTEIDLSLMEDGTLIDEDGAAYDVAYQPWLMQDRNKVIVNHCDHLIALWDGTKGGTANCVEYARRTGRVNIIRWNPEDF